MVKDSKDEIKSSMNIRYSSPAPYISDIETKLTTNYYSMRAMLLCDMSIDGIKSKKSVVICPYRGEVLKTLLFKFDVEKFFMAKIIVIKAVGEAN